MQQSAFSLDRVERTNRLLDERLPPSTENPEQLHRAMHYAARLGGKRIRPLLVYATGEGLAAPLAELDRAALAIELIHAYSLTHDDLPAMDDDELRRGQLSCHKAFDEATAILAGDALQSLAFELLSEGDHPHQLKMINILAKAAGSRGMAGGQSLDLLAANSEVDLAAVETIHQLKTGALIVASVQLGALAAPHCDPDCFQHLTEFAQHLGLAYQIQDDIFDGVEADNTPSQPCFVSALGLEKSQQLLAQLQQTLSEQLHRLSPTFPELAALYHSLAARQY